MKPITLFFFCVFLLGRLTPHIAQQDTLATTSYEELKELLQEEKDTTRALELSLYYKDRAKVENNLKELVYGYREYASVIGAQGEVDIAVAIIDSALVIAKRENLIEEEMDAHVTKGAVYYSNFRVAESIASYYKGLDLAYTLEDYEMVYSLIGMLGYIKANMEDHDGAIKILREGYRNVSNEDTPMTQTYTTRREIKANYLLNIASAHRNAARLDSALTYVDRANELIVLPNDSCTIQMAYELRAYLLVEKKEFKEAATYLKKSTEYCKPMSGLDSLRWSYTRGGIFYGSKKYRQSVDALLKGLDIYTVTPDEEKFMADYYKRLAKAYKQLGRIDSANYFLEKHLFTTTASSDLRSELSASFRDQEMKAFKEELNTLAEQKSQRDNILLYGGIAGIMVIGLLLFGLVKSHKQRKEDEQKFNELLAKVTAAEKPQEIIDTKDEVLEEQSTSDVNPETTAQILSGLQKLEDQNYFLHPACSAHNVAKRIKTNTTYLSKVINAEFGKNFSTYINDLRINYAIVKLKQDPKFRSYTVSSIATELGYKSADSFTKYFKKDTGLLPSFYIKKLNEVA